MSMAPEIIARVDAWLAARGITPGTDTRPRRIARAWGAMRDLWSHDDATEAGMTGVLLALVREAWGGDCLVDIDHVDDDGSPAVQVLVSRADLFLCYTCGPTLPEALSLALEAAP